MVDRRSVRVLTIPISSAKSLPVQVSLPLPPSHPDAVSSSAHALAASAAPPTTCTYRGESGFSAFAAVVPSGLSREWDVNDTE